ncbi:GntR family transcriptional regulator [Ornithinimicrobium avium]|uniref:GntR family transcriptional regulator n=1 Tax=Ornithinimicrobium avium TaxID=2283195 RepID=A0A345NNR9_9MICO|nr:GntR family transcriptional regulator [Ornithinimicrobium avium]AXH96677.1 GntR family transcriptional regulator [Ornithinimicrobium avium]
MQATAWRAGRPLLEGGIEEPPALGGLVRDRLRDAVMSGEIPPGARLRQVALARTLGVSRMPVRDAISALVAESLLVELPGGGVGVPVLTAADVQSLLSVREVLERHALQALVGHARTGGHSPAVVSPPAETATADAHVRFHRTLCQAAGDRYLTSALATVWPSLGRLMHGAGRLPEHVVALDATLHRLLLVGDRRRAATVLEEQFALVRRWLDLDARGPLTLRCEEVG